MNYCILLSGGKGKRMGSNTPKQYLEILGHPLIYYSLKAFQESPLIDRIIIVSSPNYENYFKGIIKEYNFDKVYGIAKAGQERYDSVFSGLSMIPDADISDENVCLIHDGARPLVTTDIIENCVADALKYKASVAAVKAKDTIKVANKEGFAIKTPDRASLYQIQTPQSFGLKLVIDAYKKMYEAQETNGVTDDAMVVSKFAGVDPFLTESSYKNIKATTPEDLAIIECFLSKVI